MKEIRREAERQQRQAVFANRNILQNSFSCKIIVYKNILNSFPSFLVKLLSFSVIYSFWPYFKNKL